MDEAESAEPARKGGTARKMLLISVLLLMAVAASVSAALFIHKNHSPAAGKTHATKPPPAKPIYFSLDPPLVVNFDRADQVSYLQVGIDVMTRDPAARDALKQDMPVLRNNLIMLFSDQSYATLSSRKGKQKLRDDVLDTVRKVVRQQDTPKLADAVQQVYFTSFVMQ